jgi:hypothetical protein
MYQAADLGSLHGWSIVDWSQALRSTYLGRRT